MYILFSLYNAGSL